MPSARAHRRNAMRSLRKSVQRGMLQAGMGRGPWFGESAAIAVAVSAEVTEQLLSSLVARLDQLEALSFAAGVLAASQHAQSASRDALDPSAQRALQMNFHSENAMAARVILELAVRAGPTGTDLVDEITAINIGKLSHQVWRWKLLADRVSCGLVAVNSVSLGHDGTFTVDVADQPPFSMRCFESTYMNRMARPADAGVEADVHLMDALVKAATEAGDFPEELLDIDHGLRQSRGYGLIAALAALSFLARWAGGPQEELAGGRSTRASLIEHAARNVADWYPHVDLSELREALGWSIWSQELIQETPLSLHLNRDVPARLYSRPVVELLDRTVFVPSGSPDAAIGVLVLRLLEGTWPERLLPSDDALAKALERRRASVRPIGNFENQLDLALARLGLPYLTSVTASPESPSSRLGVTLRRELDAVVRDPRNKLTWVIEGKDLAYPFEAKRIRSELDKYFRPKGHVDKLTEKCKDVRADAVAVARAFGHSGIDHAEWAVQGMFVTREPSPASCDSRSPFPFVLLSDLERTLGLSARELVQPEEGLNLRTRSTQGGPV